MARAGYCKHNLPIEKGRECIYCRIERDERERDAMTYEDYIRRIVREELAKLPNNQEVTSDGCQ